MHDRFVSALRALVDREGGFSKVAAAAGCNPQTLYQIVRGVTLPSGKPKGVGRRIHERLDRAFPGWTELTHSGDIDPPPRPSGGTYSGGYIPTLAQQLSAAEPIINSPHIAWESLLSKPLPPRFRLVMPDDAMALPDPPSMRKGDWAEFVPSTSAAANQIALIRDRAGNTFVRRIVIKRPGQWVAAARNSGFEPLESDRDGLEVLAVQVASGWG